MGNRCLEPMSPRTSFLLPLWLCAANLMAVPPFPGPNGPPERLLFKSYGPAQGLSGPAVTRLAQDSKGLLWVGTQGGLFCYEGHSFKAFGRNEGLPSAYITALCASHGGTLWAGTWEGLSILENGRFRAIPRSQGLPASRVHALGEGPENLLWVAMEQGLFHGNEQQGFQPAQDWPGGKPSALWVQPDGTTWVASGANLFRRDLTGAWTTFGIREGLGKEPLDGVLVDKAGRVLARSPEAIRVRDPGVKGFRILKRPSPAQAFSKSPLRMDDLGRVLCPMGGSLGLILDGNWREFGPQEGIPGNSVQDSLIDSEGSLWIGGQGLHRALGLDHWRAYSAASGLPDEKIWTLRREAGGGLLLGTSAGLCRPESHRWTVLPGTEGRLVRTFARDPQGQTWFGGSLGKLSRFDPRTGMVREYGPHLGVKDFQVLSLTCDAGGTLWVGTDRAGLFRTKLAAEVPKFERLLLPGAFREERIHRVTADAKGSLWVAAEHGLLRFREGLWQRHTVQDGLRHDHVAEVAVAGDGSILVGYFEPLGMTRFEISEKSLHPKEHLLDARTVFSFTEDFQGRLWIGTDRGVFLRNKNHLRHFQLSDGLIGEDCGPGAILADSDGDVWIGTSAGLARFLGRGPIPSIPPSRAQLIAARLGDRFLVLDSPGVQTGPREAGSLEIHLGTANFQIEDRIEFQFRLLGHDPAWRQTRSPEAHFSKLPPGSYEFQARARALEGEWGPVIALPFRIPAAWWQWRWLQALGVLAIVFLVGRLVLIHLRNLKRRTMELEVLLKLADSLTRELETANLSLQEQSLTDPLTGLRNRRYLTATIPKDLAHINRHHRRTDEQASREPLDLEVIDLLFLMVDIDHFKWVNDTLGHAAGDTVLQQLGEVLRSATRGSDTVLRGGGEEFLVVAGEALR